jgi:hypothetical protein
MMYEVEYGRSSSAGVQGRISRTAVMDVTGFLFVSLGSSTVQLDERLGSRRTCSRSEAGFSSQNGDRIWQVYYRKSA